MLRHLPLLFGLLSLHVWPGSAFATAVELGHPAVNGPSLDGWRAIMLFDKDASYTNTSGLSERVTATNFTYFVGAGRGRVTPFIFEKVTENDFIVLAIGDTRVFNVDYTGSGAWSHPFSTAGTSFVLAPGKTIGVGFTDANPDGSGSDGSVIKWTNGGSQVWLTGGGNDADAGSISLGAAPTHGSNQGPFSRSYSFNIEMDIAPAGPRSPTGAQLSNNQLFTGMPAMTEVGVFTAADPDENNTHTFQFVSGAGDTDNASFTINGETLLTASTLSGNQDRSIRVEVEDHTSLSTQVVFNLIVELAHPPTSIQLNPNFIARSAPITTTVFRLLTTDQNPADAHSYTMVAGAGDTHNAWFSLMDDRLSLAQAVPAVGKQLSIRVRSTDLTGLSITEMLNIQISDIDLRINEVLAANQSGLTDEDGELNDWIELHNFGGPLDLSGWHLSDSDELSKWTFPELVLSNNQYLVIFASGKNRTNGTLHANFGIQDSGETIILSKPDLTPVSQLDIPEQFSDVSYGHGDTGIGYLLPTPGAANGSPFPLGLSTVAFSHERGFYTNSFQLTLNASVPGATLRYTTNNSKPGASNGQVYTTPITITPNTLANARGSRIIRAVALHPDAASNQIETHSYLFVNGVTGPATDGITGQNVYQSSIVNNPTYTDLLDDALLALPAISIVRPTGLPGDTEGETSIEFFDPEGQEPGFQANCGIKKVGGHSVNSPKNNFRLYFRNAYGQSNLTYPLFANHPYSPGAADRFERLNLRSGSHDSFFWLASPGNPGNSGGPVKGDALYLRNRWVNDIAFTMGHEALHGRFAQLFINGEYRGQYQIHEWPNNDYLASYLPGKDSDYEFTNGANPVKAGSDNWQASWTQVRTAASTSFAEAKRWIDLENLADYMLLNFYAGNPWDWNPNQNWMAGGPNQADLADGWKFFNWDSDICLQDVGANVLFKDVPDNVFTRMMNHADFQVLLRDRIFMHCFHDGALRSNRVRAVFQQRVDEISTSIVAETARWQGAAVNPPWDRDDEWQNEVDRMTTSFFPQRTGILLDQFRTQGWYPVEAPEYQPPGGSLPLGQQVSLSADSGIIYYTTDESDPRLPGGAISSTAKIFPNEAIPISQTTVIRTRALDNGEWSALNETYFTLEGTEQLSPTNVVISEVHYHPATPGEETEFIECFNPTLKAVDLSGASLRGAVDFNFPAGSVIEPGQYLLVVEDLTAFASMYQNVTSSWHYPDLRVAGQWSGTLANNEEEIMLSIGTNLILRFTYRDSGDWPGRADGAGSSAENTDPYAAPLILTARNDWMSDGDTWRPSSEYHGSPGRIGLGPDNRVVINEILTHTDLPAIDTIELFVPGTNAIDLTHWVLSDERGSYAKYRLPSTLLNGGDYLLLDESQFNNSSDPNSLIPFALSASTGDDVYLLEAKTSGDLMRFVDHVEFGAARNGESFGRWPDGEGTLLPMQQQTFGSSNTNLGNQVRIGPVVIVNVHYNPLGDPDDSLEFIRFYNDGDQTESLANWRLRGEIDFDFPALDLAPGTFFTLVGFAPSNSVKITAFKTRYRLSEYVELFGPWQDTARLNNGGGSLRLQRPDTLEVPTNGASAFYPMLMEDLAVYEPQTPWPIEADGSGSFLERAGLHRRGDLGTNWVAATLPLGFGYPIWALETFPPGTTEALMLPQSNFDADPFNNYAEYVFGTDPTSHTPPQLRAMLVKGEIRLIHQERLDHPGLRYTLEQRLDLRGAPWSPSPSGLDLQETFDQPNGRIREMHWRYQGDEQERVFRVRVE